MKAVMRKRLSLRLLPLLLLWVIRGVYGIKADSDRRSLPTRIPTLMGRSPYL